MMAIMMIIIKNYNKLNFICIASISLTVLGALPKMY